MKSLERLGKRVLAVLAAMLFWRPGRRKRAEARLASGLPGRILLVRTDNRVGESLLTTPLIDGLTALGHRIDLLAHPSACRVLEGHPHLGKVIPHSWRGWSALAASDYAYVIHCGNWSEPSVGSAIFSRLAAGRAAILGPSVWPSSLLADVPIPPLQGTTSEAAQRLHLGHPLGVQEGRLTLSFRPLPSAATGSGYAVINPGGRLDWRRAPVGAFIGMAQTIADRGLRPVVTWGPGEEGLAREVVAAVSSAEMAPSTNLDALGALMHGARFTVCNNTGPMHLAVAVACPTFALFVAMDIERWGHPPPHKMLDITALLSSDDLVPQVKAALAKWLDRRAPKAFR